MSARPGLIAAFDSAEAAIAAAQQLRADGLRRIELFLPYDVEGASEALEVPRPRTLTRAVLGGGLFGAATGYAIQWYTTVISYPLDVGGRPLHSAPAFVPITFETAVLFGAFAAFFGFFLLARLPRLWQPVFEVPGFERATRDGFWLAVDPSDPRFDPERLRAALVDAGAVRIEALEGVR